MGTLNSIYAFLWSEAKNVTRDKMTLFWVVLFPIFLVLISSTFWANPNPSRVDVGFYSGDVPAGPLNASLLINTMNSSGLFEIREYASLDEMLKDIRSGRGPSVGIYVPESFSLNLTSFRRAVVYIYRVNVSEMWAEYEYYQVRGFLLHFKEEYKARLVSYAVEYVPPEYREYFLTLVDPLNLKDARVSSENVISRGRLVAWMVLATIGVEIMFIGLSFGATMIYSEKSRGSLKVILSSPVPGWAVLAGKTLASLLYVGISAASCLAAGILLGAEFAGISPLTLMMIAVALTCATIFTTGWGLLISPLAKSERGASGLATAIAWPLIFVSGVWIPKWMLPGPLKFFAEYFPLTTIIDAIRGIVVFGWPSSEALHAAIPALLLSLLTYTLGAMVYRRMLLRTSETP